ncbi:hypothetical protein DDZ14_18660 [Maritimibacter sp. 55A14]|uniref:DUF3179 domain-containing protein n=1 Tax=Maritimibacter sp. 55A14 TaxID=2174844 RepID=UPI000D606130|nr:DUF3179 domain-containing protein [Maritimibacter sp. 55A14]PWE28788.1 hypothetical protein DDZ14_18660 [Maritimibacter sp. 55A14]
MRLKAFILSALAALMLAGAAVAQVEFWKHEWPRTDFSRASVDLREIISGGPPKDGIPAIWDAEFQRVAATRGLDGREPVIAVELEGATPRAYPIRYLMYHEIANDVIGGVPVAVTYCPLCNSAMVFDRRVNGQLRTFGVSGKLRNSDMVMYDRETESWWQQAIGEGIVGHHTGDRLRQLPSWMESWDQFRARNPEGLVMAEPNADRPYGHNPYRGYDSGRPFLYSGEMPPHGIAPNSRVIRVGERAWPMERLRRAGEIREAGIRLTWAGEQASALDTGRIAQGRSVGSIRVRDGQGRDMPHDVMFAFAFHAFYPDGRWMIGQ